MAIFNRLDRMVSRACDRQFAVGAIVGCMTASPNGRPQPDISRGEIHLKGIFDQASEYAQIERGPRDGKGNELQTLVTGQQFQFSVDTNRYPAVKGVRQGDMLTLDDARRFEVVSNQPDGMARTVLILVRI
ncbi:hypothetical protein [Shinella pollutisoli]|uniref:Uncharacterized protein n=1 Tax=Shinella pollutisoli TaxID=2250594 RepID=A0ABV7DNG5_9HYPH|nr:hypothetical protein [Shinella pollutisoli]